MALSGMILAGGLLGSNGDGDMSQLLIYGVILLISVLGGLLHRKKKPEDATKPEPPPARRVPIPPERRPPMRPRMPAERESRPVTLEEVPIARPTPMRVPEAQPELLWPPEIERRPEVTLPPPVEVVPAREPVAARPATLRPVRRRTGPVEASAGGEGEIVEAVVVAAPKPVVAAERRAGVGGRVRALLKDRRSLEAALVLREVLGPPVGMREGSRDLGI